MEVMLDEVGIRARVLEINVPIIKSKINMKPNYNFQLKDDKISYYYYTL